MKCRVNERERKRNVVNILIFIRVYSTTAQLESSTHLSPTPSILASRSVMRRKEASSLPTIGGINVGFSDSGV